MKKIIICCDRCGETIDGFPMKLSVDYINRIDGQEVYQKMPDPIRKLTADECERDYCERCMQEILEFARMNVDPETYLSDKTGKEIKDTESSLIPVEMPEQEKPDTEQQERKRGRPPKDGAPLRNGYLTQKGREKIEQMYALGVDPSEVAKEMGLPEKIVINAIADLEKLG